MFGYSGPTPYDVNFRLLGTPVRVSPWFWVMTLVLGTRGMGRDLDMGLVSLWVGAVFVSILLHEFGHVFAAKMCHWRVNEVVLHQFGGYASLQPPYGSRLAINDILISLAGPCAGFLLFGGIKLLDQITPGVFFELGNYGLMFVNYLLFINLYWGLFNLLPIFPLDGGQATRTFLMALFRGGGKLAAIISIVAAAGMGLYLLQHQSLYMAIMMLLFVFINLQMLSQQ